MIVAKMICLKPLKYCSLDGAWVYMQPLYTNFQLG